MTAVLHGISHIKESLTPSSFGHCYTVGESVIHDKTHDFAKVQEYNRFGVDTGYEVVVRPVKELHKLLLPLFHSRAFKELRYPTNPLHALRIKNFIGSKEMWLDFEKRDYIKITVSDCMGIHHFYVDLRKSDATTYPIYPYLPDESFSLQEAQAQIRELQLKDPEFEPITALFNRHGVAVSGKESLPVVYWEKPHDETMKAVNATEEELFLQFQAEPPYLNGEPATKINLQAL